jgi:hypothetical protein
MAKEGLRVELRTAIEQASQQQLPIARDWRAN